MLSFFAISASAALISSAWPRDSRVFGPMMKTSGRSLPSVKFPTETWRGCIDPHPPKPASRRKPGSTYPASRRLKSGSRLSPGRGECLYQARLVDGRLDEGREERVRLKRLRLQLGMELHADEPGM